MIHCIQNYICLRLGLDKTATKGNIEATPIISNKAIIMIVASSNPALIHKD